MQLVPQARNMCQETTDRDSHGILTGNVAMLSLV